VRHGPAAVASDASQSVAGRAAVGLVVVGIGAIGQMVLRAAVRDARFNVWACVDPRADRDEIAANCGFVGPTYPALAPVGPEPRVAALCMGSRLEVVAPLARTAMEQGYDVVTTAEELIAPKLAGVALAAEVDGAARRAGRSVLVCGINPGFAMDVLPAILTMPTRDVKHIRVLRRTDVAKRRHELQEKLGVGITLSEFERRRVEGTIGHVGLRASIVCLAETLGWYGETTETLEAVPSSDKATSLGVRHTSTSRDGAGEARIEAVLEMYAGVEEIDEVRIEGVPSLTVQVLGGISGDEATVSTVLNAAAGVREVSPGLHAPTDLLPPLWRAAA
jgi:hypothetical protein